MTPVIVSHLMTDVRVGRLSVIIVAHVVHFEVRSPLACLSSGERLCSSPSRKKGTRSSSQPSAPMANCPNDVHPASAHPLAGFGAAPKQDGNSKGSTRARPPANRLAPAQAT